MKKVVIEVSLGNSEMNDWLDVKRALREWLPSYDDFKASGSRGIIRDTNGNRVGSWEVSDD